MTWNKHYSAGNFSIWQGRPSTFANDYVYQSIRSANLSDINLSNPGLALLGFACDEGVRRNLGRIGAAKAPEAIRKILAGFTQSSQTLSLTDFGNIQCLDQDLEAAQYALAAAIDHLIHHKFQPIILGGGHETAWGTYLGIKSHLQQQSLAIINFDAHLDMRPLLDNSKSHSGSAFLQMAMDSEQYQRDFNYTCIGLQRTGNSPSLIETAKKYRTKMIFAEEFYLGQINNISAQIQDLIQQHDAIYLSLCMDVFAAAYAPGVSSQQPLGLTPWQVIPLLRQIAASGKVLIFDVVELSPPYDNQDMTTKLAASLVYEFIQHRAQGKTHEKI